VIISVRRRPKRSLIGPKITPPTAQPMRNRDVSRPVQRGRPGLGRTERKAEQRRYGVGRHVIEKEPVEDVKSPAQPGGGKDGPLVTREIQH
jgi:hypothetical protein